MTITVDRNADTMRRYVRGLAELMEGSGLQYDRDDVVLQREVLEIVGDSIQNHSPLEEIRDRVNAHMRDRGAVNVIPNAVFDEIQERFAERRPNREFPRRYRAEIERLYDLGISAPAILEHIVEADVRRESENLRLPGAAVPPPARESTIDNIEKRSAELRRQRDAGPQREDRGR
jgi:hypothetical protein